MTPTPESLPLRDIHLPDPVSWWPPAPGWWGLAAAVILLPLIVHAWISIRRRGRLKRDGLKRLRQLAIQYRKGGDAQQLAADLSVLLRRLALTLHPRHQVAALTGEKWLAFLDQGVVLDSQHQAFSEGVGRALIEAPYNPTSQVDGKALISLTRLWIVNNTRDWRG